MILRVTVQIKNFGKLESNANLFDPVYTGNHVAIFECELKTPPQLALIDTEVVDFLHLHRINFRNWKLVDVDHFMKGNSYFSKVLD
jgi:hypothetical protein